MKTIIHIGQHKTGTTSIQHYLHSNRDSLANAGLYVPDSLLGYTNPSHFLLNVFALDEGRESTAKMMLRESVEKQFYDTFEQRLREDVRRHYQIANKLGCREIIWTNEGLYLLNSVQEYNRLRQLFDEFSDEVQCVCCFRDKETYLASYKKQLASLGLPLSDDPDSYRYLEKDSWLLDYRHKEELLTQVFDTVSVLHYDPQDMVKTFLENLGLQPDADTSGIRLNAGKKTSV